MQSQCSESQNMGTCVLTLQKVALSLGGDHGCIHTPELHFEQYVLHLYTNSIASVLGKVQPEFSLPELAETMPSL